MTARCRTPLEQGRLCPTCSQSPDLGGLRRCSRVIAESPAMRALLVRAARFAGSDGPVVILGESGSGKEVLARLLHANSPRAGGPFVAVNVAALPGELLESELFGHEKGAFTGAVQAKPGLFEAAEGGTLFLDEIGEMPLALQAKLLRALQDGEVRRVGALSSRSIDARILCASNRDLPAQVQSGRLREDLWYRLKVFTLRVPPLRERREDVLPLFDTLLELEGRAGTPLTPAAVAALLSWAWPGNVRELANAARFAVALTPAGQPITLAELPEELSAGEATGALAPAESAPPQRSGALRSLAEVEREHVLRVVAATESHEQAARVLGIGRTTLWRKLRSWGEGGGPSPPAEHTASARG